MSGMVEVYILVQHALLTSRNGFAACAAEGCGWEDRFHLADKYGQVPLFIRVAHADHQLELLAAVGFGSVKEAAAKALEDVDNYVDEVMFHKDEETGTGPLVAGRGPLVCLLRERAAAIRGKES